MKESTLICGANWLGDCIMSMPAVQAFKARNPSESLCLLSKAKLAPLWEHHPAITRVISFETSNNGTFAVAHELRSQGFDRAFIFPNSFRSAFIVYCAGIPQRTGVAGHWRRWMLNDHVRGRSAPGQSHQAWEYFRILRLERETPMPSPGLEIGTEEIERVQEKMGISAGRPCVALIPGAARGPSKRWPMEHFAEAGKAVARKKDCRILLLGTEAETGLCADIAHKIGPAALNLAGRTSLMELAALLASCHAAVANDSGGMHLAAGVGTPVVAVFGMTDPAETGPLGQGHRVVAAQNVARSRDIGRHSAQAAAALRAIPPRQVIDAVYAVIASGASASA